MAIYELTAEKIRPLAPVAFREAEIRERQDLQRLLRDCIEVISNDTLIIAEEFGEWEESRRRIDLLGIDKAANLVVIELKRSEDGGHMELQAIRYAAMISTMTYERAVSLFREYLERRQVTDDAESQLLDFLGWEEPDEELFAQGVRIVLASAEFSKELTTSVIWLNQQGLDIRCVRLRPYRDASRTFLDVQQVIPLPEAEEYQVQLRQKSQRERASRASGRDFTRYDVTINGHTWTAQAKRRVVLLVVRRLAELGFPPDAVGKAVGFRKTNSFYCVPGEVRTEQEFIDAAKAQAKTNGREFAEHRFFTADEELIAAAGKTYAVSNHWGNRAIRWAREALSAFPQAGVKIEESDGLDVESEGCDSP